MTPRRRLLGLVVSVLLCAGLVIGPATPASAQAEPGSSTGLGGEVIVDRGGNSIDNYRLKARHHGGINPGGWWIERTVDSADALFQVNKAIVKLTLWLVDYALRFEIANALLSPVESLTRAYNERFVERIGLPTLMLMLCVFWFGLAALRGRVGRGMGEIFLSFLIAVIGAAVIAAPGKLLLGEQGPDGIEGGLMGTSRDLGLELAALAVTDLDAPTPCVTQVPVDGPRPDGCNFDLPPPEAPVASVDALRWRMQVWLVDVFVRQPHQIMAYGVQLDCPLPPHSGASSCRPHPCLDEYEAVVATNPNGAPESYMYDMMHPDADGCPEGAALAEYLNSATYERHVVGLLVLAALIVFGVYLVVGVLVPVIVGQLILALLTVALVFVIPISLVGGGGRRPLWRWCGFFLGTLFMLIASLIGLGLLVVTVGVILANSASLILRLTVVVVAAIAFIMIQRRLLRGALSGGAGAAASLGRISGGGGPGDTGWTRVGAVGYGPLDTWRQRRAARAAAFRANDYGAAWARRRGR